MTHLALKYICLISICILGGCRNYTNDEIAGLWQLEVVEIDALEKPVSPTFMEIKPNRSFAVSRVTGDLAGVYRLENKKLRLFSEDQQWFNNTWKLYHFEDLLELRGRDEKGRNARLRFTKIEKMPDFQEFEDKLLGKWQLYKIRKDRRVEALVNTWFSIERNGHYSISSEQIVLEEGVADINARHRKLFFENDNTEWLIWFYGQELRLTNELSGVEYSLRKPHELSD